MSSLPGTRLKLKGKLRGKLRGKLKGRRDPDSPYINGSCRRGGKVTKREGVT